VSQISDKLDMTHAHCVTEFLRTLITGWGGHRTDSIGQAGADAGRGIYG
jgi:hypothetical protein